MLLEVTVAIVMLGWVDFVCPKYSKVERVNPVILNYRIHSHVQTYGIFKFPIYGINYSVNKEVRV